MLKYFTLLILLAFGSCAKFETKELDFGVTYAEKVRSDNMKLYSIKLGKEMGDRDLLIDTNLIASENNENPVIYASLVKFIFKF